MYTYTNISIYMYIQTYIGPQAKMRWFYGRRICPEFCFVKDSHDFFFGAPKPCCFSIRIRYIYTFQGKPYTYTHINTYTPTYTHIKASTYVYTSIRIHIRIHISRQAIYVYTYQYVYIYISTYQGKPAVKKNVNRGNEGQKSPSTWKLVIFVNPTKG